MKDSYYTANKRNDASFDEAEVPIAVLACPSIPVPMVTATRVPPSPGPNHHNHHNPKKASADVVRALQEQGYTEGLIESIARSNETFPLRIWVVDNSGSMNTGDGHKLLQSHTMKLLNCSRWAELKDTVEYHARAAALLEAPTTFWLLNPCGGCQQQFGIAEKGPESIPDDLTHALLNLNAVYPTGVTPLAARVREIAEHVSSLSDMLTMAGQKAVIVLATDGLPSNSYGHSSPHTLNEFKQALRSLEGLPVWVVIRLCTDDDDVVDFYNDIDNELELSLDVLDDFLAEAKEVHQFNPWLNYALPLHRMREMGFYHKLFDLLDERALTRDELREFMALLYGALDGLPDPQLDWQRFLDRVASVTRDQPLQWNPIKRRMSPWIDIRRLDRKYGDHPTCGFLNLFT